MTQGSKVSFSEHQDYLNIILLELLSLSPLFILLGNVVPPFPIKLHFIGFGLVFLVALAKIILSVRNKWFFYVLSLYIIIQPLLRSWDIKSIIDFFFGPLILISILDIIYECNIKPSILKKYTHRFVLLIWIPIIISLLQYTGVMPFTFWNATFINSTLDAFGNDILRPNGFLYHGSELSILICFVGLFQFFKEEKKAFWILLFLIFCAYATYFKAVVGCMTLLFLYYLGFINKGGLSHYRILSRPWFIFLSLISTISISLFLVYYLNLVKTKTGYYFPPQLLTGRGSIWNIYSEAIKNYSFFEVIFGAGLGASSSLFTEYATPANFYPLVDNPQSDIAYRPHNSLLNIFIDSGIAGLSLLGFLFYLVKQRISNWWPSQKWNNRLLIGIVVVPIITIGITIGVFDMAIYWCCLSMLIIRWYIFNQKEEDPRSIV